MSADRAPRWTVPVMRLGNLSRAVIYVVIGVLALLAAWHGGQAEGTSGALSEIRGAPWGIAALWVIAAGLFAYAAWRLICAWMDLEEQGTDAKAMVARAGQTVTGLIHVGLGVQAVTIALGNGGGGGSSAEDWTARLLSVPFGQWLTGIVGAVVVGAGAYYVHKGLNEKFRAYLRWSPTMEKLTPFAKAGLVAHGVVIAVIGSFLIFAARTASAEEAGGLAQAFDTVRAQPFGRTLLALLAVGMVCFAVYCVIEAVWRVVPRAPQSEGVVTLAKRAEIKAKAAAA